MVGNTTVRNIIVVVQLHHLFEVAVSFKHERVFKLAGAVKEQLADWSSIVCQ